MARLSDVALAFLIVCDVIVAFTWIGALYLFNLADKPNGRQTISGYVGKASHNGHRWGRRLEWIIDGLFGAGHCQRCFSVGQGG